MTILKKNLKQLRRSAIGLLLSATALSASLNRSSDEGKMNYASTSNQPEFSLEMDFEEDRLYREITGNLNIYEKFSAYLNYYKILMEARKEGRNLSLDEEGSLFGTLMEMSGFHSVFSVNRRFCFEFACVLYGGAPEERKKEAEDLTIDMLESAAYGSRKSPQRLTDFQSFFTQERLQMMGALFFSYKNVDGLKALYEKTNNKFFLFILSELVEGLEVPASDIEPEAWELLRQLKAGEIEYMPKLDIKIAKAKEEYDFLGYQIARAESQFNRAKRYIDKSKVGISNGFIIADGAFNIGDRSNPKCYLYFPQDIEDPIDSYTKYVLILQSEAQDKLRENQKELDSLGEKLGNLRAQRQRILGSLSAEELYILGQEYKEIAWAESIIFVGLLSDRTDLFRKRFFSVMEEAAYQKGFEPAEEELRDIFLREGSHDSYESRNAWWRRFDN